MAFASSERNAAVWSASILTAVTTFGAIALAFSAVNAAQSLWSPTLVRLQPNLAAASSFPTPSSLTAIVQAATPSAAEDSVQYQVSNSKSSSKNHFQGAFVLALGLCAAAWARFRMAKGNMMTPLDLEEGMTFASTAGENETTYYFLVANAKFMLFDEEHGMELLREKRRFMKEKALPMDFWIVPNPEFLDNLPDIDKRVLKPCAALVSTDERWILFMKLRYDKVLTGSFKGSSDIKKALATKGGDALAAVPKFELPKDWEKNVPYPKYADDWFHPFLVNASS
jgi:hypothetical protein